MKNKKLNKILGFIGMFIVGAFVLTGCNSFCSALDSASYKYAYDPVNTMFFGNEASASEYVVDTIKKAAGIKEDSGEEVYTSNDESAVLTTSTVSNLVSKESTLLEDIGVTYSIIEKVVDNGVFNGIDLIDSTDYLYYITSGTYTYYTKTTKTSEDGATSIVFTPQTITFSINSFVNEVNTSAISNGINTPLGTYWNALDNLTIKEMYSKANRDNYLSEIKYNSTYELFYGYSNDVYNDYLSDVTSGKTSIMLNGGEYTFTNGQKVSILGKYNSLFARYGRYKYVTDETENALNMADGNYYGRITNWNEEIRENSSFGSGYNMDTDYLNLYESTMNTKTANLSSCITISEGFYGHINNDPLTDTVLITDKSSWKDAWEHGFLEGLLVYPISYMVEYFSHTFGMNGWGQIGSVLLVTLIVRGIFMLLSFRSTLSQQKMQYLQPEIAKLQQKYPHSNTNEYEKQRLAQAQMNLYKRYKVHPFSSLIVLIFQFPIFIAVWNAMRGSASLSVDAVLGLRLSDTISNVLFTWSNWPSTQCWTALVLIVLMSGCQIVSMLLPQWLSKARTKNIPKMYNNPAANSSQKQMKIVSYVMTAFIIIMGFTLPAAMGVYWLAGALFSMIQTTIMHFIMVKHKGELAPANNKVIDTTKKKFSFSNLFNKKNKK